MLVVVDDFICECFCLVVDILLFGVRMVWELDSFIIKWGKLRMIVLDNGMEMISMVIFKWC